MLPKSESVLDRGSRTRSFSFFPKWLSKKDLREAKSADPFPAPGPPEDQPDAPSVKRASSKGSPKVASNGSPPENKTQEKGIPAEKPDAGNPSTSGTTGPSLNRSESWLARRSKGLGLRTVSTTAGSDPGQAPVEEVGMSLPAAKKPQKSAFGFRSATVTAGSDPELRSQSRQDVEFGMSLPAARLPKKNVSAPVERENRQQTGMPKTLSVTAPPDELGWKLPTPKVGKKGFSDPVKSKSGGNIPRQADGGGPVPGQKGLAKLLRSLTGGRRGEGYEVRAAAVNLSPEVVKELQGWVERAKSEDMNERREAAVEILRYTKKDTTKATLAFIDGGIEALVGLLKSQEEDEIVELAVTGLLNLSLVTASKEVISRAGALPLLARVLRKGTVRARANAAACMFSVVQREEEMAELQQHGAVESLLQLVRQNPQAPPASLDEANGGAMPADADVAPARESSPSVDAQAGLEGEGAGRSKRNTPRRDAILVLLKLSSSEAVCRELVQQRGVSLMVKLMDEEGEDVEEEAAGVLANMARTERGCRAILGEGGVDALVDALESGSMLSKEFAVAAVYYLVANRGKFLEAVLEADMMHLLHLLEENGSKKAQKRAQQVIKLLEDHEKSRGPMLLSLKDELMSVTVTDSKVVIL